jgi:hypothetical protein
VESHRLPIRIWWKTYLNSVICPVKLIIKP